MLTVHTSSQPVLMDQTTGSDKSTVPLTIGTVDCGITIEIENTLSLGTNQSMRVRAISNSTCHYYVRSYHLDSFESENDHIKLLSSIVNHCLSNNNTSVIIFTLPESLLKPIWLLFISTYHDNKIINLLCIDEIHLFVDFSCSFRFYFQRLKQKVFKIFCKSETKQTTIPLLLMTATFNQ